MATAPIRVAISGGGLSGCALGAILTNQLGKRVHVDLFERADKNRDEGYGLDLDKHGQEALRQAGVFHRYWEVSRPRSDTMTWCDLNLEPQFVSFRPRALRRLFPGTFAPEPESSRSGIRQLLIDAMGEKGGQIHYGVQVADAIAGSATTAASSGDSDSNATVTNNKANLIDTQGNELGKYDLIVDASGVHSPLRRLRVHDDVGTHYNGVMMIHGIINNPEKTLPSRAEHALELLAEGSLCLIARGYSFVLQRFAPDVNDKRTAFFYQFAREDETTLLPEIGITASRSRKEGIITEPEALGKIKAWMHEDIGDKYCAPALHDLIDALDRATVRGHRCHGPTTLRDNMQGLPLVCIGDALRNIGIGGGGNMALKDATDVAAVLIKGTAGAQGAARIDLPALNKVEQSILDSKTDFFNNRAKGQRILLRRPTPGDDSGTMDPNLTMGEMVATMGVPKVVIALLEPFRKAWMAWYLHDRARDQLGSPAPESARK